MSRTATALLEARGVLLGNQLSAGVDDGEKGNTGQRPPIIDNQLAANVEPNLCNNLG